MNTNLWWGYLHVNGGINAHRYLDSRAMKEAEHSTFVKATHGPFEAAGRLDALMKLKAHFLGETTT